MKRTSSRAVALIGAVLGGMALSACESLEATGFRDDVDPRDLEGRFTWVLQRWTEGRAVGYPMVQLTWLLPSNYRDEVFRVYGRDARSGSYQLIATVTSCIDGFCRYDDINVFPGERYDYYVATVDEWDGDELGASREVTVDVPAAASVQVPAVPRAVALDGAVFLQWSATGAQRYMVLGQAESDEIFVIGETDGTSYLDDRAVNGTRYRYYLAGVDPDGFVSGLSTAAEAFPRPDFHADIIYALADDAASSGFRFVTSEDGDPIVAGTAANAQWRLEAVGGTLRIQPLGQTRITAGVFTTQLTCGPGSEANCVDVSRAPADAEFGAAAVAAETGRTYVLRVVGDDNRTHFGKVRVQGSGVDTQGRRIVVFDWAYQLRPDERALQLSLP